MRHQWDDSPPTQTPMTGQRCAASSFVQNAGALPRRLSGSWIRFIQRRIEKVVSVAVSVFVAIAVAAKPSAAASTTKAPACSVSRPGRSTTRTPAKPSPIDAARVAVMRSRRNSTASSATQAGAVNSSANTVASGKSVTPSAQA